MGFAVGAAGACFGRVALLREAAALWVVSDPVRPADLAVVLEGGVQDRPFAAASYYANGLGKKILVSNEHTNAAAELGAVLPGVDANRAVLNRLGVPPEAIEVFGDDLKTTRDEAVTLKRWLADHDDRSIIVPTEIFSTRRVTWMFRRTLGSDYTVQVPALDAREYRLDNWWRNTQGLIAFQNEILKYIYYRLRY